ncbi:metallophosphoesterase [Synechococcales cyanobacterium C]|uniref:Metallophosphoesterase n=1 Tax=Petrachloros mirabilis ULC683 TaxID=2781853 RepID=A0A8K2A0Y5_9CYAN|nr:metallophosphoesterase [Petrachloros mirabilis]NCJ07397.1 metallophosphoesterase [Petrachloros mirabilis ULC683]
MYSLLGGSLRVERLTVPIRNLPPALAGLQIAQLSDLHFDGLRLSERLLHQAIAATNAAKPDLVVLTGDYVTDEPDPIYGLADHLRSLQSRLGTYAILGNHDLLYARSQPMITKALGDVDIRVLWDEVIYPFGEDLALVGLRDYWSPRFNPAPVMQQIPAEMPRIVLSHNPDSAKSLQRWRVDLQLSGHTHGGQVIIPGVGPIVMEMKKLRQQLSKPMQRWVKHLTQGCDKVVQHWEWAHGLHQVQDNWLYVNRGLGTYLPGRLFCPPEVTLITLVRCHPYSGNRYQAEVAVSISR